MQLFDALLVRTFNAMVERSNRSRPTMIYQENQLLSWFFCVCRFCFKMFLSPGKFLGDIGKLIN